MRKELYFPTPIYFRDIAEAAALNADLMRNILAWRAEDPEGLVRSNVVRVGAWHSRSDMHRRTEYNHLSAHVLDCAAEVFEDQAYDPDYEPALDMMWANISPRYGFNRYHNHPGVLWSGVYYVRAPDSSGDIIFTDPRAQAHVIEPHLSADAGERPERWPEVHFAPTEGRLLLFPAWLSHQVEPNLADGNGAEADRVSISFNLFQRRIGVASLPDRGPIVRDDLP